MSLRLSEANIRSLGDVVSRSLASSFGLTVVVDIAASLDSLADNEHVHDGMLKLPADLDRYELLIERTRPEVVVETGTWNGASAQWFSAHGLDVITVDLVSPVVGHAGVTMVQGDSANPAVVEKVIRLVAGRRCMVSLDSVHDAPHVAQEIDLYGPLVTPGCYLVVEDGIFGYAPRYLKAQHGLVDLVGSPLNAITEKLLGNFAWTRATSIERLSPVTHHPAGWWIRR
jgi:cephalosporin hydroxylase